MFEQIGALGAAHERIIFVDEEFVYGVFEEVGGVEIAFDEDIIRAIFLPVVRLEDEQIETFHVDIHEVYLLVFGQVLLQNLAQRENLYISLGYYFVAAAFARAGELLVEAIEGGLVELEESDSRIGVGHAYVEVDIAFSAALKGFYEAGSGFYIDTAPAFFVEVGGIREAVGVVGTDVHVEAFVMFLEFVEGAEEHIFAVLGVGAGAEDKAREKIA